MLYTAKNTADLLHVVNFTCQQVAISCLLKSLVATCHLQTCYNLLKQLAKSPLITSFDNQLATSLLTTCNRLVVTSCRKPCEHILISVCCNKLLQDVNRLVATCVFFAVYAINNSDNNNYNNNKNKYKINNTKYNTNNILISYENIKAFYRIALC